MKKTLMALVCGALLTVPAFAADATGNWTAEMKGRNGETRETKFDLKQDGSTLTGKMIGPQGREMEISNGKVDGDTLSFDTKVEMQGESRTISYTGTISGDEIKMKRNMPAGGPGGAGAGAGGGGGGRGGANEFVAKRVK